MSKTVKALIIGGSLCILGFTVFITGYFKNDRSIGNVFDYELPQNSESVQKTYTVQSPDTLSFIRFTCAHVPFVIEIHDEKHIIIEYSEDKDRTYSIEQSGNRLVFTKDSEGFFKDSVLSTIQSFIYKKPAEPITVYLPASYDKELLITTSFGDITFPVTPSFNKIAKLDLKTSFGTIGMSSVSGNILNVKNSYGSVECSDIKFNYMNVLSIKSHVLINYAKADSVTLISDRDDITLLNLMTDLLDADINKSEVSISFGDYKSEFNISVNKDTKSDVNVLPFENIEKSKKILLKATDSTIKITFLSTE